MFVANGRDGLLYRDPAGTWVRWGTPKGGEGLYFEQPPRLIPAILIVGTGAVAVIARSRPAD